MINLFDYVKIFPDAFPDQLTKHIFDFPLNSSPAVVTDIQKGKSFINDSYRVTDVIDLPDEIKGYITGGLRQFWDSNLTQYYQRPIKKIEPPQFLRYNIGGRYDVHNDSEDYIDGIMTRIVDRDVTVLVYLNDDYEGGELEFPDFGLKIKPKKNMVITFPSYYEYQHKVHPVTLGERYTLVTWIETEGRIYERSQLGRGQR